MKVLLNVPKSNQYSHLNGKEFEVVEFLSYGVSLIGINPEFPTNQVDFSFNEINIRNSNFIEFVSNYIVIYHVGNDYELFIELFGKIKFNELIAVYKKDTKITISVNSTTKEYNFNMFLGRIYKTKIGLKRLNELYDLIVY